MTIRRNKYDVRRSLARQMATTVTERRWRVDRYPKPVWTGLYEGVWTLKVIRRNDPKAEIAEKLLVFFPVIPCWGRELSPKFNWPTITVRERVLETLPVEAQRFFHWKFWWEKSGLYDRRGEKLFRIDPQKLNYYYEVVIRRKKVKSVRRSDPFPEVEKIANFLYRTGFAAKYLWQKHRSNRYVRKIHRKSQRELNRQIGEGLEIYKEFSG